jgi:hypothetical protein
MSQFPALIELASAKASFRQIKVAEFTEKLIPNICRSNPTPSKRKFQSLKEGDPHPTTPEKVKLTKRSPRIGTLTPSL